MTICEPNLIKIRWFRKFKKILEKLFFRTNFCHGVPTVRRPKKIFALNFFKCIQRLKFKTILESEQQGGIWIYLVNSKMGGAAPPTGGTQNQKYFGWWTLPMSWSNHQSFVKIRNIEVRQAFVSCVEILLIWLRSLLRNRNLYL